MPKNKVTDLITDQEMVFAHLVLSGNMTDRQAAETAGLNPESAAYTKAKPRVRAYMAEHRAALHEKLLAPGHPPSGSDPRQHQRPAQGHRHVRLFCRDHP